MFLQEVVDLPKLDLELFKGPQHPKGFHWRRLLGGGDHARDHVFLDFYTTLVNDPSPTSFEVFQNIQHMF
jgi:hypothetical protein